MKPANCAKEELTALDTCAVLCVDTRSGIWCINDYCRYNNQIAPPVASLKLSDLAISQSEKIW